MRGDPSIVQHGRYDVDINGQLALDAVTNGVRPPADVRSFVLSLRRSDGEGRSDAGQVFHRAGVGPHLPLEGSDGNAGVGQGTGQREKGSLSDIGANHGGRARFVFHDDLKEWKGTLCDDEFF